jgi:hypothetical protein
MATLLNPGTDSVTNLCTNQVTNAVSTNTAARRVDRTAVPALMRIVTTIGATPTCTYLIEGSPDNSTWYPLPTQDITTAGPPGALTSATFVITTATTTWKLVAVDFPWTFIRITFSANTNVTNTVDLFVY